MLLFFIGTCALAAALLLEYRYSHKPVVLLIGAVALGGLVPLVAPAFAAEGAGVGAKAVVLPYGDWIAAIGETVTSILVPILTGVVIMAVRQIAPWATSYLTNARVESMVAAATRFGLNAVAGATAGAKLSVPVGSAVIAQAVQRAVDAAPAAVVDAAGGPAGVAGKVFRELHLDETATVGNTLTPVLDTLPSAK